MQVTINGRSYNVSTTLRVVYEIQKLHGNKPYMEVFGDLANMTLDMQLKTLYAGIQVGNPGEIIPSQLEFISSCLDTINLTDVMEMIGEFIEGIMFSGLSPEQVESKKAQMVQPVDNTL